MSAKAIQVMLPVVTMLVIASAVLNSSTGMSGELVSTVWAMETGTLEKEAGQEVSFKVKVKNTGTAEAIFIVDRSIYERHDLSPSVDR